MFFVRLGRRNHVLLLVVFLCSQIEMEEVPARTVIGKTEYATWKDVAPVIARMRTDARQHFAATGVKGGSELSSFSGITAEGADVLVGKNYSRPQVLD